MKKILSILFGLLIFTVWAQESPLRQIRVSNQTALNQAIRNSKPGDIIIMTNGVWKNIRIEFKASGTVERPIVLKAETPGKVTIEGESNLKIGGSFLIVKDLYFKNGYTPTKDVIQFKVDDQTVANNCTITNCVIDTFTQPERSMPDHWIEFWGRNNELSNSYITGKYNSGPTIMVRLDGNENIKNYHKIVNNYFGPRPRKGGPHGETIQIGDSYTSMVPSHTIVNNNLFDHCNGEVEIISSKSNDNQITNNIFFESEGSVVLRHGNYAKIDGNVFIGNDNSEFIGGIRVINTGHWITNNYFYKLRGKMFRSPLAVMNGIPQSPQNRYNQVTDVVVAYNTFIDCVAPLQFGVGSNVDQSEVLPKTEIRSARPKRMIVANNLIYNHTADDSPIIAHDKLDGITFKENILNPENKNNINSDGMIVKNFNVHEISKYLFVPATNFTEIYQGFDFNAIKTDIFGTERTTKNAVGCTIVPVKDHTVLISKKNYGTSWFNPDTPIRKPKILKASSSKELVAQIARANSGDVITLKNGTYIFNKSLPVNKNLTIRTIIEQDKAELRFTGSGMGFQIYPATRLELENLIIKGNGTQNAFETLPKGMSRSYNLFLKNIEIDNFNSVLEVAKDSFADTISIANSVIQNTNFGLQLNKEIDDRGEYNAEFVLIENTKFNSVKNNILDFYRGGYDESTIGGYLVFKNNIVTHSGGSEKDQILMKNRGIVNVFISDNIFKINPVKTIAVLWGEKDQKPLNNTIEDSGEFRIVQNLKLKLMY